MSLPLVLDVAIGLVGFFFALSLLASAVTELARATLNRPGKILEKGIGYLLGDKKVAGLAKAFYEHPLIRGLSIERLPSGISPAVAAEVLLDIANSAVAVGTDATAKAAAAEKSGNPDDKKAAKTAAETAAISQEAMNLIRPFLETYMTEEQGQTALKQINDVRASIANWFKEGVDRLNGVAARESQIILLGLGLAMATSCNIDAIAVTRALMTSDALRQIGVAAATDYYERNEKNVEKSAEEVAAQVAVDTAQKELNTAKAGSADANAVDTAENKLAEAKDKLADVTLAAAEKRAIELKEGFLKTYGAFPIGWSKKDLAPESGGWNRFVWWSLKLLGFVITAVAISMGSQFWYGVLGGLLRLRGPKPAEDKKAS